MILPDWIKHLMMWRWLNRAYYKCGSDIFCPTIHSGDLDYRLNLSDGHYYIENVHEQDELIQKFGKKAKRVPWKDEGEFDDYNAFECLFKDYNFTLEDMFIGLFDRLRWEDDPAYEEILKEMDEYMEHFIGKRV